MRLQILLIVALGLTMPGAFADPPDKSPKGESAEKHELKKAKKKKAEKSGEKATKDRSLGQESGSRISGIPGQMRFSKSKGRASVRFTPISMGRSAGTGWKAMRTS